MPRIIHSHRFPYHIIARSNERDWFARSTADSWQLFISHFHKVAHDCAFRIHAFVLMSNHYHMIACTSGKFFLCDVLRALQASIKRTVGPEFGQGTYSGRLITTPYYYAHVLKYVYRNPVQARLCTTVEEYPYSTVLYSLPGHIHKNHLITFPPCQMDYLVPYGSDKDYLTWLNS